MKSFENKIAVVTGGGTGMGRELVLQLVKANCNVSMCDVIEENMDQTMELAAAVNPNVKITKHLCDVSIKEQVEEFRDNVLKEQQSDSINLLFNNAGIGGGQSFIKSDIEEWEKVFAVCWYGVYFCSRAFMEALIKSDEGHLINTSSVNGFWASLGDGVPHTSYSAAKFAVKGFSEALLNDFKVNAPHLNVSVVMPGHIGTDISQNTGIILGKRPEEMKDEELQEMKDNWIKAGAPVHNLSLEVFKDALIQRQDDFKNNAITSAEDAATIILDGVKENKWRILIAPDAAALDRRVRDNPEKAYDEDKKQKRDDNHFTNPFSRKN